MPLQTVFRSVRINPNRINVERFWQEARVQTTVWMHEVMLAGEGYPAPPLGSRYIRTGLLVGSWDVVASLSADVLIVSLVNPVTDIYGRQYMTYVQGPRQTAAHRGNGWTRMDRLATSSAMRSRLTARLRIATQRSMLP
jgi:hypothetical protein